MDTLTRTPEQIAADFDARTKKRQEAAPKTKPITRQMRRKAARAQVKWEVERLLARKE